MTALGMEIVHRLNMRPAAWIVLLGLSASALVAGADDSLSGLADPTRPQWGAPEAETVYTGGPVLQSTFITRGQRRALISGRTYNVGDRLGNAVVENIQSHEVVLKEGARETRLRLVPKLTKEQKTAGGQAAPPKADK